MRLLKDMYIIVELLRMCRAAEVSLYRLQNENGTENVGQILGGSHLRSIVVSTTLHSDSE